MKRLMVVAALAASSVACVANQGDAPIRFLSAGALRDEGGSCSLADDKYVSAGALDLSGGNSYLLGLRLETNNTPQQISVGGEVFSGGGLSDITLNEVILTYESQPSVPLPREERIPIYTVFRPGTAEGSYMLVFTLGPEAIARLQGVGPEGVTVLSTIKARGRMSSGQPVETNEITFPVFVFESGAGPGACTPPQRVVSRCGYIGQDGPVCRSP